ncbi:thiamine pyrophosphate-binding protein [Arthrobacter deserti]|uniref:Thiamine pyrophosphate-binding protein n=1 Tax=Arthrobacter deserti TaxID=1742687 RepID=A0ABX1JRF1_9MICC|nr:thiamine pyrophosphate-binding protein [Arthrobacter deserti]
MTAVAGRPANPTATPATEAAATVPQAVARVVRERAAVLFGLMGNGNAHLISELTSTGFPFVTVRHEAGAVAAADAYFRASGKPATATVTYGAGFTNTLTALSEAAIARIPLILIVGDAPTSGPRFFDVDQAGMAAAAGVETVRVDVQDPAAQVRHAYDRAAAESRPIVVAIPYDLVEAPVQAGAAAGRARDVPMPAPAAPHEAELEPLVAALRGAERPLIIAGRGVVDSAGAPGALRRLADGLGAFIATSVMARQVSGPEGDLGIAGGFARLERVELMRQADVVLVVGAGMNPFQMRYGTLVAEDATVLQVDSRAGRRHGRTGHFLVADAGAALGALAAPFGSTPQENGRPDGGWRARQPLPAAPRVEDVREDGSVEDGLAEDGRLNPRTMALALEDILPRERTFVQDGGHFIGWIPLMCSVPDARSHLFVGTAFQSIGLGFPSAVGAAVARPERTTVLVTGDGGGLMALADFESFVRQARSGVVVVFNDAAYGAELHQYAARGLDAAPMLIEEVDFAALGRAFGAEGIKARSLQDLDALRDWVARGAEGVFVLDLPISQAVVAEYMAESMAGAKPAPRPLPVD